MFIFSLKNENFFVIGNNELPTHCKILNHAEWSTKSIY